MKLTVQERLRTLTSELRIRSTPLSTLIPLLQQAADLLDEQQREIQALESRVDELNEQNLASKE